MPAPRTPCPTTEEDNETARWLCVPGNRRISTFLENVHTWYHEHSNTMTEAQVSGVERWRQRHNPNQLAMIRVESLSEVHRMWLDWLSDNDDEDLTADEIDTLRIRFFTRRGWQIDDSGAWVPSPSELPDEERRVDPDLELLLAEEEAVEAEEAVEVTRVTITPAQARLLMEGEMVALEPRPSRASAEPATADWAGGHILNGVYSLSSVGPAETYKVHTITYSRNNPGLVGKRVVSHYREGDWKTFAFLTTEGGLKVWRRYEADSSEQYVVYARQLLKILNDAQARLNINRSHTEISYGDEFRAIWTVSVTQPLCRFCNAMLSTSESQRAAGHCGCQSVAYGQPPAAPSRRTLRIPRSPRGGFAATQNASRGEIHTVSEVDGIWEQ